MNQLCIWKNHLAKNNIYALNLLYLGTFTAYYLFIFWIFFLKKKYKAVSLVTVKLFITQGPEHHWLVWIHAFFWFHPFCAAEHLE